MLRQVNVDELYYDVYISKTPYDENVVSHRFHLSKKKLNNLRWHYVLCALEAALRAVGNHKPNLVLEIKFQNVPRKGSGTYKKWKRFFISDSVAMVSTKEGFISDSLADVFQLWMQYYELLPIMVKLADQTKILMNDIELTRLSTESSKFKVLCEQISSMELSSPAAPIGNANVEDEMKMSIQLTLRTLQHYFAFMKRELEPRLLNNMDLFAQDPDLCLVTEMVSDTSTELDKSKWNAIFSDPTRWSVVYQFFKNLEEFGVKIGADIPVNEERELTPVEQNLYKSFKQHVYFFDRGIEGLFSASQALCEDFLTWSPQTR
jgi:hypothetical protein